MHKYYFLASEDTECSDYIYLDEALIPQRLRWACRRSEFQYVDQNLRKLNLEETCGNKLPDFICSEQNNIPLISERLKIEFDRLDVRNLFYQRLNLYRKSDNLCETYWLAIPPRIDCLYKNKCEIDLQNHATILTLEEEKAGNYNIFKLAGINNNEIIVTQKVKDAIKKSGISEGFYIFEDENLRSI